MTREIKFRAWDGEKIIHNIPNSAVSTGSFLEMRGTTLQLMQYTGLKDKNGKEIYHFDILSLPMRFHGDHTLKPSIAVMQWEHDGWYVEDQGECGYSEMEVIGNIYENPELLEQQSL